jgi:hypothetical protein
MNYEDYQRALAINKHNIDSELEVQAVYQEQIAEKLAKAEREAVVCKQFLAVTEARLTQSFKADEPKANKEIIEGQVIRDRDYKEAWADYQDAVQEQAKWQRLLESWRQRSYSLKTLADLYSAQYFALDSTQKATTTRGIRYREESKPPTSSRVKVQ